MPNRYRNLNSTNQIENIFMKSQLLIIVFFACIGFSFSQDNCEEKVTILNQKLEVKSNEIFGLKQTVAKQLKEIGYYKEVLELLNSKIVSESKDVEFKINTVKGNQDTGVVVIEGLVTNKGVLRSIQGHKINVTDAKGNGNISYQITIGDQTRLDKLLKDVPTKFVAELEGIVAETPMLKAIILNFYSRSGYKKDDLEAIFKNVTITWE